MRSVSLAAAEHSSSFPGLDLPVGHLAFCNSLIELTATKLGDQHWLK